ncbi:hypothetical protein BACINT_01608 [Bacteroides intestinalis DSM 17393]|uniref:Uncharacterized protein n=1 Tax=Bacteroides intestinalis DSM 17393 TaxID=471870 RepID=B3C7R7_9BACE|nr:hypothetical protein BACINT_01608 [Bacteroides intestinalis DSM 17393]
MLFSNLSSSQLVKLITDINRNIQNKCFVFILLYFRANIGF